jgi:phage shock protein A
MLQEVVIKTNAEESLKPLLEVAIRNQLKALQHGITRTKERIAEFEKRTGMSSAEFEEKMQSEKIEETLETIDWNMELAALRLLESQYHSLHEAKID